MSRARVRIGDQAPCPGRGQKIRRLLRRSHEERASGGRARPELAPAPEQIGRGDALVVAPIDRIARSLPHLLEAVERLEAKCTVRRPDLGLSPINRSGRQVGRMFSDNQLGRRTC
ncbi:hypothetical protein C5F48_23900 [Cereibacter changlensis JA139]|uniref:Resolvase/invertase-type recombinase catalytic domain-containing protein n=1 Tax=Cereibacter changlensis JA139 TaxID=1188249 RepID=A0A2T4JJD1_9RHOB|nr:hypothetical protein C5F48_23900 [Cereibacter changlensis JA139]